MGFWSIMGLCFLAVVVWKGTRKWITLHKLNKEVQQSRNSLLSWYPSFDLEESEYGILEDTKAIEFREEHFKAIIELEMQLGISEETKEEQKQIFDDLNTMKEWVKIHKQNQKNYSLAEQS